MSAKPKRRYEDKAMSIIAERNLFPDIARECGIARQAPHQWKRVPAERAHAVHKVSGLSLYTIRPDLFPRGS